MNAALFQALIALLPAGMLFFGAVVVFSRGRAVGSFLQLVGAGSLVVVVLTHICEALRLFPWMQWGLEATPGHYLDLGSAILTVTLFPLGYFATSLVTTKARR